MAVKTKKSDPKKPEKGRRKLPLAILFWAAFFIIIFGLFVIRREDIRENLERNNVRLPFFGGAEPTGEPAPVTETPADVPAAETGGGGGTSPASPAKTGSSRPAPKPVAPAPPAEDEPEPFAKTDSSKPAAAVPADKAPAAGTPAPADSKISPAKAGSSKSQKPAQTARQQAARQQARIIYFTQVSGDGKILRSPVTRQLPESDSPMLDALNALLAGPSAAEQDRGMLNLIPQGSRILGIQVQGHTAYVNFNEEFMYNTYGVEGYAAQLRQVVWTATEFPNVSDVQILIEGRRVDYLGEGIWIGSPISREE